jgi:hypothetical protein
MPTTTPIQALPVPVSADTPNIPADLMSLAQAIEGRVQMRFTNSSDRDTKVTSPVEGMTCVLTTTREYQQYTNSGWTTYFTGGNPSGPSFGRVVNYPSGSRPAASTLSDGMLGVDRTTGRLERVDAGGWSAVNALPSMVHQTQIHGSGGLTTAPGNSTLSVAVSVTITRPNTWVNLSVVSRFALLGAFEYLGVTGGFIEVDSILYAIPPSSASVELRRVKQRNLNTGTGTTGGPTAVNVPMQHVYLAVGTGAYAFHLRMFVNGAPLGNGSVANYGGDITVMPINLVSTI